MSDAQMGGYVVVVRGAQTDSVAAEGIRGLVDKGARVTIERTQTGNGGSDA